jgi:hypothetical protein
MQQGREWPRPVSRWSDFKTAVASFALAVWFAVPAQAGDEVCANPPDYRSGDAALDALLQRVTPALEEYPSLRDAVSGIAPAFCISGEPFNALGFYEPETRKIVVSEGLDPDLQLAILFHELRHVEHHARGLCPDLSLSMRDYARAVWAMEADAATISLIVAWDYAEGGDPGPWDALVDQPRFGDIARTFGAVMSEGGDIFTASEAAFTAWYQPLRTPRVPADRPLPRQRSGEPRVVLRQGLGPEFRRRIRIVAARGLVPDQHRLRGVVAARPREFRPVGPSGAEPAEQRTQPDDRVHHRDGHLPELRLHPRRGEQRLALFPRGQRRSGPADRQHTFALSGSVRQEAMNRPRSSSLIGLQAVRVPSPNSRNGLPARTRAT